MGVTGVHRVERQHRTDDAARLRPRHVAGVADLSDARAAAHRELVEHTRHQIVRIVPTELPAAVILTLLLAGQLPIVPLLGWVGLVVVDVIRTFAQSRSDDVYFARGGSVDGWLRRVLPHGFAYGLTWGVLPVLSALDGDRDALTISLVVALAMVAIMTAILPFRRFFLAAALGVGVPNVVSALALSGNTRILGILGILYIAIVVSVHRSLAAHRFEAAELKHVNAHLAEALAAEHRRVQEANDQLSSANRLLSHRAHHDALTGLANRALVLDHLGSVVQVAGPGAHVAVLYCDLDGFKSVNDRFGHPIGDQLLVAVANRLRATVGHADVVARLGGDEFLVVLAGLATPDLAIGIAERVVAALVAPFAIEGHSLRVGVSVGVATTGLAVPPKDLVRQADDAMYRAKQGSAGPVVLAAVAGTVDGVVDGHPSTGR